LAINAGLVMRVSMLKKVSGVQQKQIEDMSPPFDVIKAMIQVESGGNRYAYNKYSGAVGLMQLTPIIYKNICHLTKQEAFNASKNIACGALYLQTLINRFNGNLEKALAFYNAGENMNQQYSKKVLNVKP
jgi:soluble lytic murein transglycosylase-like protein